MMRAECVTGTDQRAPKSRLLNHKPLRAVNRLFGCLELDWTVEARPYVCYLTRKVEIWWSIVQVTYNGEDLISLVVNKVLSKMPADIAPPPPPPLQRNQAVHLKYS